VSEVFNIDDIGLAEELINRWLTERRTLENGVRVLNAFKYLKVTIPQLQKELDSVCVELDHYRALKDRELQDYEDQRTRLLKEVDGLSNALAIRKEAVEKEMTKYIEQHRVEKEEIELDIQFLHSELTAQQTRYKDDLELLEQEVKAMELKLASATQMYEAFLEKVRGV
jgi:hypothetical protein